MTPGRSRWRRPLVLALVGVGIILGWLWLTRWRFGTHVYDEAGALSEDQRFTANVAYATLMWETGADVRVVITRTLGDEPIEQFALRWMRDRGIGQSVDRRGALLVLDLTGHQVRLEVGPKLEGIMTDAYAGYVAHDVLTPMLADSAQIPRLLSVAWHVLRFRIDEGLLDREWDPAVVTEIQERQRLALGGGAGAIAVLADAGRLANQPTPPELRDRYTAQPTAAEALARYEEWVQEPFEYDDVGLVSDGTRDYSTIVNNDVSAGAWRFDQIAILPERYHLVERGPRAVAIPTSSPLIEPVWFVKGKLGWQFDATPVFTVVHSTGGGPYTWGVAAEENMWTRTFGDLLVEMSDAPGVYRFQDGNNTALPNRGHF